MSVHITSDRHSTVDVGVTISFFAALSQLTICTFMSLSVSDYKCVCQAGCVSVVCMFVGMSILLKYHALA